MFVEQKGFIVATLISTILGTFTTSMNLHDKYQEKKDRAKQKQLDEGQDKQIKQLQAKVDKLQSNGGGDDSGRRRGSRPRLQSRRSLSAGSYEEEDFDRSARKSRAMIEREFDANVRRLGSSYAQGDVIAENKLQGQVIQLQQTVINVLQDALLNERKLSKADIHRLVMAQDNARQGSLDALRDQYDRMLQDQPRQQAIEYNSSSRHPSPPRRQLTLPAPDSPMEDGFAPVRRVKTQPQSKSGSNSPLLYCRYAADLQRDSRRPLHPSFSTSGTQRCPACSVTIPVTTKDVWVFETRTPRRGSNGEDVVEVRSFSMDARLVVKSHTPSGELMCIICYHERNADCLCASVEALVRHIGRVHSSEEFSREEDMVLERG